VNWASNIGQGIADAEEEFVKGMFEKDVKNESN
jgi:hypothetical protein